MTIKIRELKIKDGRALVKIMRKLISDIKQVWLSGIVSDSPKKEDQKPDDDNLEKLGIVFVDVIEKGLQYIDEDITEWFASLCNMTVEEYLENAPINAEFEIIKQIKGDEKFKDFLSGLSAVFNVDALLSKASSAMKDRFPSVFS
jgi:CRISPR/Cas system-associated exonuclease Cas4 (RecB family)